MRAATPYRDPAYRQKRGVSTNAWRPDTIRTVRPWIALLVTALTALAQQPPPPYGAPMSLDAAKKAMTAAEAEAKKNNWPVAIAILDTTGSLVMLQKLDNTQTGSVEIAINKARTALDFRRPSKALQDVVSQAAAPVCVCSPRATC